MAAGGAVLAVGSVVKVTPVVGLVALLATLVVVAAAGTGQDATAPPRRWLPAAGLATVVAFTATGLATRAWVDRAADTPPLIANRSATPLTYVAAGMRVQADAPRGVTYGGFDWDVWVGTRYLDHAGQDAAAKRLIRQEWEARGPAGMLRFAVDKTLFNWGDGMLWARGEGTDATSPPVRAGPRADAVTAWTAPGGAHYRAHVTAAQVIWLATLLAMGAGLLLSRYRPDLLLATLTVAGIALFTLVFQGRSRYLIGHVPVVVALAAALLPGLRPAEPGAPVPEPRTTGEPAARSVGR